MPCDDVTEILELTLDEGDRLARYRLRKRTCGRAVGEEALLAGALSGMTDTAILAIDAEEFANGIASGDDAEYVLCLKHVFALQGGLRALTGRESAGKDDPVRAASITFENGETTLEAVLSVDVLTEKIKSCGKCKGCGVLTKTRRAAATNAV